jgi:hypothetical protein
MKCCVIISGQTRTAVSSHENIRECLIHPNDADVFIHSWDKEDGSDELRKILDLYKPKAFRFDPKMNFKNDHLELSRMMVSHGRGYDREFFVRMIYSSWYSMLQANLLKESYRLLSNTKYDCVIRARFDITYNRPVVCVIRDENTLHISNRNLVPNKGPLPSEMIDDRFGYGSESLMNLYFGGFNLIDRIHLVRNRIDGIFCGETLVYEMVKTYGLDVVQLNDLIAYHNH